MRRAPVTTAGGWFAALLACMVLFSALTSATSGPPAGDDLVATGKRLYREGRTGAGAFVQAAVRNDVSIQGSGLACTNCHRRSGLGSSESGIGIPPITGNTLFTEQTTNLVRDYSNGELSNISRPAYTLDTLARALRAGINSSGRTMSPLMPRYQLNDHDIAALYAYLATLSNASTEGITEHELHFATVVTPDTSSDQRHAMLDVMQKFFADKNSGTRGETRRAERAPFHREWVYAAYRKWVLHEWTLSGPASSWGEQLDAYYQRQPVFALLGGIGHGNWQAVHTFCEHREIPCLFPHLTAAPANAEQDFYSIYFSKGLPLEAEALAAYLKRRPPGNIRLLQVLRPRPDTTAAAAALRAALPTTGEDHLLNAHETLSATFWQRLLQRVQPEVLVLWLDTGDLAGLTTLTDTPYAPAAIYLSSTLLPYSSGLTLDIPAGVNLLHPYMLPGKEQRLTRFRIWAKQAGITLREPQIQADAYFAVTLAGEALMHMRGNLSREYLIERIEHMTDSMLYTSTYPRLDLAPGQRYAAKGVYIWHLKQDAHAAEWVVP